jgi:SAM-dependent MidA family methyltransferase
MDEFQEDGSRALVEALARRIRRWGPITFRDYMEICLYHPRYGYYAAPRPPMGHGGDYLTSPELGPVFPVLLGRQLHQMWEVMGCPHPFQVVEVGGGTGALARGILAWARRHRPLFYRALRYIVVERSPYLRGLARRTLVAAGFGGRASFPRDLPPASVVGCILANEVVDAFPAHRVYRQGEELLEVYVGWDGRALREELGPLSTPDIAAYFRRLGLLPGEGCYAEVNLEAPSFMRWVGQRLSRGFALIIDYGYEAPELYAPWRRDGTLMCFYRHRPSPSPYLRPGAQDMTAHVDFTTLMEAGQEVGLRPLGLTDQAHFLARLGIEDALRAPGLDPEEFLARRRAISELMDPAGLGRLRVLVLEKGVGPCRLQGLHG